MMCIVFASGSGSDQTVQKLMLVWTTAARLRPHLACCDFNR